jgi:Uma2 family endonuclease
MSLSIQPVPESTRRPPAVPADFIWRLTLDQYHAMVQSGILTDDDPVELLEGWLVTKIPKKPSHRTVTRLVRKSLEAVVPAGWVVESQEPITVDDSEPEPDVSVVRGDDRRYADHHPGPDEVGMLVEVADTTLKRDRGLKKRISARARMPVYWIVNLVDRRLEVYTDPTGPADEPDYRQQKDYGPTDEVPVIIEGAEVGRLRVGTLIA